MLAVRTNTTDRVDDARARRDDREDEYAAAVEMLERLKLDGAPAHKIDAAMTVVGYARRRYLTAEDRVAEALEAA